jgi:hypothetical protein
MRELITNGGVILRGKRLLQRIRQDVMKQKLQNKCVKPALIPGATQPHILNRCLWNYSLWRTVTMGHLVKRLV